MKSAVIVGKSVGTKTKEWKQSDEICRAVKPVLPKGAIPRGVVPTRPVIVVVSMGIRKTSVLRKIQRNQEHGRKRNRKRLSQPHHATNLTGVIGQCQDRGSGCHFSSEQKQELTGNAA